MMIKTQINMDLVRPEKTMLVRLVQKDKMSRSVQLRLFADGEEVMLPENCRVLVRYGKPDGTGGSYDTMPDGSSAWQIAGNAVTVKLAPQVCNVAGKVKLSVSLLEGEKELNCFAVYLDVQAGAEQEAESGNYVYLTGYLPQPGSAEVGQYVKVAGVDALGRVTAVETADAEAVPGYVRSEAQRLAQTVQQRQNGGTFSLLCCSDPHYSASHGYTKQMAQSVLHAGQAMAILRRQVHLDGAAMLGDLVWDGGETAQQGLDAMRFVNEALADGFSGVPNFRTRGNHDCMAQSERVLTDGEIFANVGIYNDGVVMGDRVGGWCYRDYPDRKIRVVCLNTAENSAGNMAVSDAQNAWLQNALAVETGWSTVLLSHHPLDWLGSGSNVMQTVKKAVHVLCNIHGHTHCYATGALAGTNIPRLAVPNMCFYRNNEYGQNGRPENGEGIEFGEEITYEKVAGTAQDTAFCVVTIDREAGAIFADHYGAGYDRAVELRRNENLVQGALDYDLEGVFGEQGYRDGYYVSTAAPYYAATADGSVATGLIPYDIYGGVEGVGFMPAAIEIQGVTFDTSNSHNRIGFFVTQGQDPGGVEKEKFMYAALGVAALENYFTIETLGEKHYRLTPKAHGLYPEYNALAATWWESSSPISHIAISGNGSGAEMVVKIG